MAEGESSSNNDITINIKGVFFLQFLIERGLKGNAQGPSELKLQITISLDKTVLDLKHAIADKSDVPADRQRLIYSGMLSVSPGSSHSNDRVIHRRPRPQSACTRHRPSASNLIGVLQDDDLLSGYKIQNLNTIHMVKGAARSPNASGPSSTTGPATQQLPTMQTGQNPADPLTQLNGIMGHGLMAGFNPFADLGLNPNDPNMVSFTTSIRRIKVLSIYR